MWREWKTEWMKVRYRKTGLMLLAFLGLIFVWTVWNLGRSSEGEIWDGYRRTFLQMPLIDTIIMPTMIAMLASRLCDTEIKGDTLKLLCTMERKGRIFDMKLWMGAVYLALFTAGQIGILFGAARFFGFGRPLEPVHLLYFVLQTYVVSLPILLLQQVLSFYFENQILPLAAGLFGSFVGLFSWFFAGNPARKLFLWGYYSVLAFIGMDWDPETRIITYYNEAFDTRSLIFLLVILTAGYILGKMLFLRKEV